MANSIKQPVRIFVTSTEAGPMSSATIQTDPNNPKIGIDVANFQKLAFHHDDQSQDVYVYPEITHRGRADDKIPTLWLGTEDTLKGFYDDTKKEMDKFHIKETKTPQPVKDKQGNSFTETAYDFNKDEIPDLKIYKLVQKAPEKK